MAAAATSALLLASPFPQEQTTWIMQLIENVNSQVGSVIKANVDEAKQVIERQEELSGQFKQILIDQQSRITELVRQVGLEMQT